MRVWLNAGERLDERSVVSASLFEDIEMALQRAAITEDVEYPASVAAVGWVICPEEGFGKTQGNRRTDHPPYLT